jgi:hypothetical protein
MKKILSIIACLFIISGLNAWKHFTIKNNTKWDINVTADNIVFKIQTGKTRKFEKPDFKIYEFKIAETKPTNNKRTYTIAPVIIIKDHAKNAYFKASKIFNKNKLPKGFTYKTYARGLRPSGTRTEKPQTHLDPVAN